MVKGRLPGPERRRQLLAVSRQVLAKTGYHETTMTEIAQAAGVTKPVLYQHFSSKRELYRTVLTDIGSRLQTTVVEAASAANTPREKAEAGIRAYATFVEEDNDGFQLLFNGANRQDDEWATITTSVERSLAQAIGSFIDVPSISTDRRQTLAHGIIGLAESMTRFASDNSEMVYPQDQLVSDITDLAWSGLRGLDS